MTYRGTVKDGVVLIEGAEKPADGATVEITPVDAKRPTIWDTLIELAGCIDDNSLPKDASENLDHYLYGAPKK